MERVLDLAGYVPEFLREIREFQQLYGAQESELKRMYGKMDELWKDSLIPSATILGIKRFENMMGLKSYPGDTLEERRASVALKWNQQLPYTLPRLRERLEVVVGDHYALWVRDSAYELELQVIDQPYRVLQDLRDMARQMIPANLVFIFAGKYPVKIPVEVAAEACLELASDFYARYNREFLYLDGSWPLDGAYFLNGYKEIERLDLYPARLRVQETLQVSVEVGGRQQLISIVAGRPEVQTEISFWSAIPVSVVAAKEDATADTAMCDNAWTAAGNGSRLRMIQQTDAAPEIRSGLTMEKDLWYLNGTYLLDGTKLLDAEIFKHDI